jgi:hypothetical protein
VWSNPCPGIRVAAAYQTQEFLRRGYILTTVAMLLRHRAANSHPLGFPWNCAVNLPRGKAVKFSRAFNRRPTALGQALFVANIDAAAHDIVPG